MKKQYAGNVDREEKKRKLVDALVSKQRERLHADSPQIKKNVERLVLRQPPLIMAGSTKR